MFRKLWSLKEAFVKARGDGLAFPLDSVEFAIAAGQAPTAKVGGAAQADWCAHCSHWRCCVSDLAFVCRSFSLQQLGPTQPDGSHWVRN